MGGFNVTDKLAVKAVGVMAELGTILCSAARTAHHCAWAQCLPLGPSPPLTFYSVVDSHQVAQAGLELAIFLPPGQLGVVSNLCCQIQQEKRFFSVTIKKEDSEVGDPSPLGVLGGPSDIC